MTWMIRMEAIVRGLCAHSLSWILIILVVNNVCTSNCFKTMNSVHQLSSTAKQSTSYSKIPLLWRPESDSKSFPTTVIVQSSDACKTASSSKTAKCRKHEHQKSKQPWKKSAGSLKSSVVPSEVLLPDAPKSLLNISQLTPENIHDMNKLMKKKRHFCKLHEFEGFACQKFKLASWLAKQLDQESTKLNSWLELVKTSANDTSSALLSTKDVSDIKPSIWPERIVYRFIKSWGDPEDLFVFYKYKDFINSRELKISFPYNVQLKVSPRSSTVPHQVARSSSSSSSSSSSASVQSVGEARIFWDPGFNLKLKLPFFRDELKVAVSTGPAFIAGIGVGIAILIIKSMFAPFLLGMKWMMYNVFFKESSPFELMKMFFMSQAPEPWDSSIPPPAIEHYRPPPVRNHFDHPPHGRRPPPGPPPPHFHHPPHPPPYHHPFGPPHPHHSGPAGSGPSAFDLDYNQHHSPYDDMKHQYTQSTPVVQTLSGASPTMSQLEALYRNQLLEEGLGMRRPTYKSLLQPEPTNSIDVAETPGMDSMDVGQENGNQDGSYIPSTGLQAEVEHFDPFYSPLLSKIDSIFTHLGHNDEGCRERVVCSIYKFPVKYAPYSNLLSAQLSKHQSELKRPVTSSPKILRYFRYMKAAKDGQGGDSCLELYPKCASDTDSVSSLPMIQTFNQLSELMTAESSSPGVAIAAAAG